MKKLLFFLILLSQAVFSQVPPVVDSLFVELDNVSSDTSRVNLLNEIGFELINSSLAEAEKYITQAFELASRIDYKKGLARAHTHKAIIAAYRGQREEAFSNYFKALKIDSLINNLRGMASNYSNLGLTFNYLGEKEKAKNYLQRSIELYTETKDEKSLSAPISNLASVYEDLGWFSLALDNHLKSLKIKKKYNNENGVATSLINIANIYLGQDKLEESYKNYSEAVEISRELGNFQNESVALAGLASVLQKQGNLTQAIEYQQKSLEIGQKMGKKYQLENDYYLLGELYYEQQDETKALSFLNEALRISQEMGNYKALAKTEIALAKIDLDNKKYGKAIERLQQAQEYAYNSNEKLPLRTAYKTLGEAYEKTGNTKEALKYLNLYSALNDSLTEQINSRQLAELQMQYQTAKKDQEITLQKAQLTAQQSIIQQQSLERNLLIGGVASAIIILILLVYTYSNRLKVKELVNKNQRETEALRSRFFANISHEFRTPLALITAHTDDLTENRREQDQADLLGIKKNTTRLLQLVNQLLDLSRIDAGRLALKARQGDLAHFTKALIESFQSLALQRDITFSLEMDEGAIEGYFDQDQFEKVVVNLVSNAFKNTPGGGEISVSAYLEGSKEFVLSVKDTGRGIPQEDIMHIFDRFYQTSDSEGSGIGLSLTKELVELYHGTVEVESELGKGSTFTVRLPIDFDSMKELGVEILTGTPVISKTGHLSASLTAKDRTDTQQLILPENRDTILVVEDNTELRKYMADFLADEYQVIEASHGKAGLELAIKYQPDMILSDVMMPEMEGTELCRRIKNTTETSHIPFIMLTAKASGQDKLEGLDLGADDYLVKPFDKKELKTRVKNLVLQRKKLIEKFSQSLNPRDIKLNSADEKFLSQASAMVREYIDDSSFSVEAFSKAIGMSRTQLFRKIRGLTGMSVSEYMRAIRLNLAAEKLKNKTASVSEIAYEVGFNNLSYFTKCFKERFGVKPSQYA